MNQSKQTIYQADNAPQEFNLNHFFQSIRLFVVRHWLKFVIATVIAIGLGYFKYKTDDRIFESRLSGETYAMGDSRLNEIISSMNQHVEFQNWPALSKMLGMPEEQISKLSAITGGTSYDIEKKIKGSSLVVEQRPADFFYIDVRVKDTAILNELEKGIVNYLNNNPLNVKRMEAIRKGQEGFIAGFTKHQQKIDSITSIVNAQIAANKNAGIEFNPGMSLEGYAKGYRELMEVYTQYQMATEIKVLNSFQAYNKPVSPRLLISLALFVLPINLLLLLVLLVVKTK
ncbi:MAG: hypothetical protein ACOVMN_13235 [Flexibacteraceae bacterium]